MPAAVWIYAEDFVSALIGPFYDLADANEHVEFLKQRGAKTELITDTARLEKIQRDWQPMVFTPAEDREFNPEA